MLLDIISLGTTTILTLTVSLRVYFGLKVGVRQSKAELSCRFDE